jgi:adenosylcobinamide-phosphate synthase
MDFVERALVLNIGVLVLAVILDITLGEPKGPVHPVVWIGWMISGAEKLAPKDGAVRQLLFGVGVAVLVPGFFGAAFYFAGSGLSAISDWAYLVGGAVLLKTTFAVKALAQAGLEVQRHLQSEDVAAARSSLGSLVSRDRTSLSSQQSASAAVESVAENTTDSFVAPWLYFAIFGLAGAAAYRAINTLDARIGYRGRYEYFGKASARLDDLANFIPARMAGLLIVAGSWVQGLNLKQSWRIMLRDHDKTASPNAGWSMSAMAGALGVKLEKAGHYRLGDAAEPVSHIHIGRSVRTMYTVAALALVPAAATLVMRYGLF